MALADEIANFASNFRQIFFLGIPLLLNDDGAYLSFGCTFTGTEALAGYRYPREKYYGVKFKAFLLEYFDPRYHPFADELWELRNSVVHGFSPKHFALCHGQPEAHFTDRPHYVKVLNADSLFRDFQTAAERYLAALASDRTLQAIFEKHIRSKKGGGLYVF
jgi:hypothetical protein